MPKRARPERSEREGVRMQRSSKEIRRSGNAKVRKCQLKENGFEAQRRGTLSVNEIPDKPRHGEIGKARSAEPKIKSF